MTVSIFSCKIYLPENINNRIYDNRTVLYRSIQLYNDSLFLFEDDYKISEGLWKIDGEGYIILKSFPKKTKGYYCYKFFNENEDRYEPFQYIEFTKKVKIINKKLLKVDNYKLYLSDKIPIPISSN
jgi:hypothetical protein